MPFDGTDYKPSQLVLDLMAARDYLDENGWCKGQLTDGPRRCLVGAVRQVVLGDAHKKLVTKNGTYVRDSKRCVVAEQTMHNYLNEHMFPHWIGYPMEIARWNDRQEDYAPIRTFLDRMIEDELAKNMVSTNESK